MPKKARSTLSLNSHWIILSIVAAVLGTAPLAASASTLIVGDPTGAGNCIPFGCNFWEPEYQQVYASTDFPSQLTITGLTFYNSGPFSSGFNGGTYTLALSSTSKAVNGLNLSNLSNNIGSDNKVVFSGTLPVGPIPVGDSGTIVFSTPFTYNPKTGLNLLMDITSTSASGSLSSFASGCCEGLFSRAWSHGSEMSGLVTGFGSAVGDPHFTTYDGVHYDYQGIGDFLLTRSAVDQFEVQVRTRPTYDGSAVTIMSEAAATLCNHKVTFDIDRTGAGGSFVWFDGSPLSLSVGSLVLTSGGCEIDQVAANDYRLIWNTGEVLDVINQGTYLDLSSQLSWLDMLGSMEGLLSSDLDPDAWRMTGAASLFSPVPEPSTLTLLGVGIGLTGIAMMRRRAIAPKPL